MLVYCVNESVAIARSRDKLRSLQLLSRKGIGLPITVFAHKTSNPEDIVKLAGGAPVVIKLLEGTQGIGVVLGETPKAAESIIQAFGGVNTRSEEHTSELQSLMRISYAVFCLKKKKHTELLETTNN